MNFVQLKYFLAVCEFGTVSAASEYLHIAQPSLSLAIKELEGEFGIQLFSRTHRGMRPTKEGLRLLEMSRDIIERAEGIERAMRDMGRDKKLLTLGVPPMIGSLVLPVIYGEFTSENPDVCLNIVECGREQMLKTVANGQIDMAFISHDRGVEEGFCTTSLGALEMVCSATSGSNIANKSALTPKDLLNTPGGIEPQVLMKTDQLSTMTKLITAGTAAGFMFRRLVEGDRSVEFCPLSPKITVNISLIWQRDRFFSSAMKRFKDFFEAREIFK